jgi:copper transport protein
MRKAVQKRGWLALVGLCALIALLWGRPAQAHALLVRSAPAAGAEVALAPVTVDLWFSEPLEPAFSYAYLVDAAGNKFGEGATTVDPTDAHHLTLTLAPTITVPPGIYTVLYHTLSQADGHEWLGSFPLTVLNPDGSRPTGDPATAATFDGAQQGDLPAPLKAASRWFSLMGALLLTGVLAFQSISGRPPAADDGLLAGLDRLARLLLVVGIGAVFIGGWLQVLGQMTLLGEPDSRGVASGATLNLYFQTRTGRFLVARQLLAAGLLFLTIVAAGLPARARGVVRSVMFLLSVGLLATFALGSHAAAVAGSGWAILGDFIHLTAAALWLGGLIALALLLWPWVQQPDVDLLLMRQIVRRFSRLATLAVFVLVVTGLFSTLVQLPTLTDLWRTTYGQLLLLKIALVLTALGLAWFNHRFVQMDGAALTDPRFARRVWREAAVGVGIMIVVALLVQTPPPPAPLATAPPATRLFETILQADDLTIHLQISPNQVGDNRYITHLYHADGTPIGDVQLVRLTFTHQTAALGQATLDLTAQGGDFFAGAGAYQNRAGPWDVAIYVRRRGLDDLLVTTTVAVPPPVASAPRDPWQNPIATLPSGIVIGGVVAALLLLPLIGRWAKR